jgi:hypothetical protein
MHGPQLRELILDLMCKVQDDPPEYTTVHNQQIEQAFENLALITKKDTRWLKAVIARDYPAYYRARKAAVLKHRLS